MSSLTGEVKDDDVFLPTGRWMVDVLYFRTPVSVLEKTAYLEIRSDAGRSPSGSPSPSGDGGPCPRTTVNGERPCEPGGALGLRRRPARRPDHHLVEKTDSIRPTPSTGEPAKASENQNGGDSDDHQDS